MKKNTRNIVLLLLVASIGLAFTTIDPKKEIFYKALEDIETEDYKISFADVHSQATFTLMRLTIENKSDKYLVFDLSKVDFHYKSVDKHVKGKDKVLLIKPETTDKFNLKVVDKGGFMQVNDIAVSLGGISTFDPEEGQVIQVENFKIPAEKKKFEKEGLHFSLKDLKTTTDESVVKFKVKYEGNDLILLDANKIVFEKENGDITINSVSSKVQALLDDDTETLKLKAEIPRDKATKFDMQFSTFYVNFKDAFVKVPGEEKEAHELALTTGESDEEE